MKIMTIYAHPADTITNFGVTLALHAERGDEVVANKKSELDRAAAVVGISKIVTMNHDDTYATVHEEVVEQIAEHLAAEQPAIVIADHPAEPGVLRPALRGDRDGAGGAVPGQPP